MPKMKRITVSLPAGVAGVLASISALSGKSQSAVVVELLEVAMPTLERMARAFQVLSHATSLERERMRRTLDESQASVESAVLEAEELFGGFLGQIEAAAGPSACPAGEVAAGGGDPAGRPLPPRPVITGVTPEKPRSPNRGPQVGKTRAKGSRKPVGEVR